MARSRKSKIAGHPITTIRCFTDSSLGESPYPPEVVPYRPPASAVCNPWCQNKFHGQSGFGSVTQGLVHRRMERYSYIDIEGFCGIPANAARLQFRELLHKVRGATIQTEYLSRTVRGSDFTIFAIHSATGW